MTTKPARPPEQKAAHAARERDRRAARKQAENRPAEIEAEMAAAEDFAAAAVTAAIVAGTVSFTDAATAILSGTSLEDVAAAVEVEEILDGAIEPLVITSDTDGDLAPKPVVDLSEMDTITLYRKVQDEVAARRSNPEIATPHLDELNVRKGRKVIAGPKAKTAKASTSKRPARHPLFDQAEAERKRLANKRGKGTKVTSEELVAVARRLSAAGLVERQAMEVAYWVEKLAVSRGAWATAWAIATTTSVEEGAAV